MSHKLTKDIAAIQSLGCHVASLSNFTPLNNRYDTWKANLYVKSIGRFVYEFRSLNRELPPVDAYKIPALATYKLTSRTVKDVVIRQEANKAHMVSIIRAMFSCEIVVSKMLSDTRQTIIGLPGTIAGHPVKIDLNYDIHFHVEHPPSSDIDPVTLVRSATKVTVTQPDYVHKKRVLNRAAKKNLIAELKRVVTNINAQKTFGHITCRNVRATIDQKKLHRALTGAAFDKKPLDIDTILLLSALHINPARYKCLTKKTTGYGTIGLTIPGKTNHISTHDTIYNTEHEVTTDDILMQIYTIHPCPTSAMVGARRPPAYLQIDSILHDLGIVTYE